MIGVVARSQIHTLFHRIERMIGMLEDSIAIILASKGTVGFQMESLNVFKEVIEPVLSEICLDVPKERIELIRRPDESTGKQDLCIPGNRFFLKSVFRNLLKNAAAYGAKGTKIAIATTQMGKDLIFDIQNYGDPIPANLRKDIFLEPAKTTPRASGKQGGLGIGLSLVKEIVACHGGKLWYRPDKNTSHFLVSLPAKG